MNVSPNASLREGSKIAGMANPKRPRDTNQLAKRIVDISTGDFDDSETKKAAAGRAGGLKGGRTRMDALTSEERSKLAKMAADKRWKKAAPPKKARPDPG